MPPRATLYRALHNCNSTALCLSGGGIRSASFALGVDRSAGGSSAPRSRISKSRSKGRSTAAVPVQLSLHGLGRRLHRQLAVGLDCARGLSRMCGGSSPAIARIAGRRAGRNRVAASLQQLSDPHDFGLFSADPWTAVDALSAQSFFSIGSSFCRRSASCCSPSSSTTVERFLDLHPSILTAWCCFGVPSVCLLMLLGTAFREHAMARTCNTYRTRRAEASAVYARPSK